MSLPGSDGEHQLQQRYGARSRAAAFYERQMLDYLNDRMRTFIAKMEMMFLATSDANGECDASFRAGLPGFVRVLNDHMLTWPEYRGNGVMASLGNILENPHVGLYFADFFDTTVGLHVNGKARIVENETVKRGQELFLQAPDPFLRSGTDQNVSGSAVFDEVLDAIRGDLQAKAGRAPERWVLVNVEEAYIHCSKHIPKLQKLDKAVHWGTDDDRHKGGDFFGIDEDRENQP